MKPKTSQNTKIISYLKEGKTLTALSALKLFGCLRLSGRIKNLRDCGYRIKTDMIITKTGKRIAEYSL